MPRPPPGFQIAEAAIKAGRKQEEQKAKYAPQKYELRQGIVGQQPLRAQIKAESGGNAEQEVSDRGAVMVVRRAVYCQKFRSAGVQKIR